MVICTNPPFQNRLHRKIPKVIDKYYKFFSLQPVGTMKTLPYNIAKLLPLHTSKKFFKLPSIICLAIVTNTNKKELEWDVSKVPTCSQTDGDVYLKVGSCHSDGTDDYIRNGVSVHQEKYINSVKRDSISSLFFKTKTERANFIKNIGKIIPLQMLWFSGLVPKQQERLLPPLDREYSKDELLDYFRFPKDVYESFDDSSDDEKLRCSYDYWKKNRKEKYNLDWEEE